MKHFPLTAALLIVCASTVFSQNSSGGSYRVDNFDFINGVRIAAPPTRATSSTMSRRGKMRGAGQPANAGAINAIIDDRMAEIEGNKSLGGFTSGNSSIDSFIVDSGRRNAVDPLLLYASASPASGIRNRTLRVAAATCVSCSTCLMAMSNWH